jgi:quercetin dioxygenase-like cupin family protein
MNLIRLTEVARELPQAWSSRVVSTFGGANLKVLRMDEAAYAPECHDYAEGLLVLEGVMMLDVDGELIRVNAGEIYVVPAGVMHGVAAGSTGTLLILDV